MTPTAAHEYPSQRAHYRGQTLPCAPASALVWLADKRARDHADGGVPPNLWQIRGRLYDMTGYHHPGGASWLELTRGTDCTTAFETHHLNNALASAVLAKYFVRDTAPLLKDKVSVYDWAPDGFYATLRPKVHAKLLAAGGRGPTLAMHVLCMFALLAFAACFTATVRTGHGAWALATGVTLYWLMGVGHNFFHQRDSLWWRFVFDLTVFSSHNWRVSHALSHHAFPNMDLDMEASMTEPYLFVMRNQPTNSPWIVAALWHLLNIVAPVLEQLTRVVCVLRGIEQPRWEHSLPLLQASVLATSCGVAHGLGLWLVMHSAALYFLVLASTPVHRTEYGWTSGCEAVVPASRDFGLHTILATNDYSVGSSSLLARLLLFASFNDHVTHHLFPTVDLSRQHLVRETFLAHCRQHRVPYTERAYGALWRGLWAVLYRQPGDICYTPHAGVPSVDAKE